MYRLRPQQQVPQSLRKRKSMQILKCLQMLLINANRCVEVWLKGVCVCNHVCGFGKLWKESPCPCCKLLLVCRQTTASLPPEEPVVVVKMSFHTPSTRRADVGHMDDVLMMILLLFLQKQN